MDPTAITTPKRPLNNLMTAAGDDRGEDAGELVRGGGEAFGFAQVGFHSATILAVLGLAVGTGR